MRFFVPTLEGVSKINIKGKHHTDTDPLDCPGQQQASARNRMQCLCDALYDAVYTLADAVGSALQALTYVDI